ncbi:MAG: hypothetical protein PSV13_12735, partial [Lacunisphaera sp.]|nr:hypothetical protein [Lacunisphaera sp.]
PDAYAAAAPPGAPPRTHARAAAPAGANPAAADAAAGEYADRAAAHAGRRWLTLIFATPGTEMCRASCWANLESALTRPAAG